MWTTPKTDWSGEFIDGVYVGDKFNAADFNRIKNNLAYLYELAVKIYEDFTIHSLGSDRTPIDYFYADEINKLEENLETINSNSLKGSYGKTPVYADNGKIMDFKELNRIESASLDLYNKLTNQSEGRRTFQWNFGMKGGL